MIREINEFLRYVIDPGKVKALVLVIQTVALPGMWGCPGIHHGVDDLEE